MKIIEAIGVAFIVLGIVMTVMTFMAAHRPISDVESVTVQEIAPRGVGGNL